MTTNKPADPSCSQAHPLPFPSITTSSKLYIDKAIIELTISLSFSFRALIALFLETLAWDMTSSISLSSIPSASTGSPSSSSSSFLSSLVSMALPLPWEWLWEWSWPEWSCPAWSWDSWAARAWAADAWAWELRSSILASPKTLYNISEGVCGCCGKRTHM